MQMRMVVVAVFLLLPALHGKEAKVYEAGIIIIDTGVQRVYTGSHGTGSPTSDYAGRSGSADSSRISSRVYSDFVIKTATHRYIASQIHGWAWTKSLLLTIDAPVRFRIDRNNLYLLDQSGKEWKTRFSSVVRTRGRWIGTF